MILMLRISIAYISLVIIFSIFFSIMTVSYPNYFNQINISNEELKIVKKIMLHIPN